MGPEQIEYYAGLLPYVLVFFIATAISSTLLFVRAWFIGNQLERFIKGTQAQIAEYLAKHAQWSDVATLALQTFPNLIQGSVQLALSLQDLMYNVNRAGGIARVIDTVTKNASRDAPEVAQRRGRKPRIVQTTFEQEVQRNESSSNTSGD